MKIVMNRRLPIGIAILSCLIGSGVGATMSRSSKATPLIIRNGACHFSPEIERRLGLLRDSYRRYAERHNIDLMVEHVSQAAAQFAFGPLHGVALEHVNDAEWDGDTMYFSEDMTTAANALQKMGFHVGRHGYILESKNLIQKFFKPSNTLRFCA